ncbi:MAG TPA: DUF5615 family PIN-like protein [Rhizomicrobium sp.]|jgi:hypothetical protein
MKFLVDECLSSILAALARERGYPESSHVVWQGLGGIQDWNLVPSILDGDWTFVTRNAYDFRGDADAPGSGGHYRNVSVHAGLICLNGERMDREMQIERFSAVLDAVEKDSDLVNIGVEATMRGPDEILIERYDLPAT